MCRSHGVLIWVGRGLAPAENGGVSGKNGGGKPPPYPVTQKTKPTARVSCRFSLFLKTLGKSN